MDCILCKKPIEGYNIKFNQLKIDEFHSVAICSDCIDKFQVATNYVCSSISYKISQEVVY